METQAIYPGEKMGSPNLNFLNIFTAQSQPFCAIFEIESNPIRNMRIFYLYLMGKTTSKTRNFSSNTKGAWYKSKFYISYLKYILEENLRRGESNQHFFLELRSNFPSSWNYVGFWVE